MRAARVMVPVLAVVPFVLVALADAARAAGAADLHVAMGRAAATAGAPLDVTRRRATGLATFVRRADRGDLHPAFRGARAGVDKAGDFLTRHGESFGLGDPAAQTVREPAHGDALGWTRVRWRQVHDGLEVYGAALVAHLAPDGSLRTVNGVTVAIPGPLATTPTVSRVDAEHSAAAGATADAVDARVVVYPRGLVRGTDEDPRLAWAIELASTDGHERELVMVDALDGRVLERVDATPDALARQVSQDSLDDVVWLEGDPDPIPAGWASGTAAQIAGWQDEIDGARETYNFFGSLSRGTYLGYDGAEAVMATIHDAGLPCPNASWDGISTNYCPGVTSDDVVGHEWAHAYTEYTAKFFYAWQPGALHESYSDAWGESIDVLNGRQSDVPGGPRATDGSACSTFGDFEKHPRTDASYRWLMGEDATAFGTAIRDLWQPECRGDPGRVGSNLYWCDVADGGGVHTNSGVPNHLYALLVDGGTSNDVTVPAIGLVKAANILWRAVSTYETPLSDFVDHADALEASCADLIGAPLGVPVVSPPATWTTAAEQIGPADCAALAAAIAAVELRAAPPCETGTILQPDPPPLCAGLGSVEPVATYDFETSLAPWTAGNHSVANPPGYEAGTWVRSTAPPDGHRGATAFVSDAFPSECGADHTTGVSFLESPPIAVPVDRRTLHLAFSHWFGVFPYFDGGNVKVGVNGGTFKTVPSDHFTFNPYNATLTPPPQQATSTNPLAGQPAWTGSDLRSVGGSWGESQIDLDGIAARGDTIRVRFDFGRHRCFGLVGWYVDDVRAYSCSADTPPCPEAPRADCKEAPLGRSRFLIKHDPLNGTRERMQWSWSGGAATTLADVGDPSATTRYDFCVWDGRTGVPTLVSNIAIPDGSRWKMSATGAQYTDKRGTVKGVSRIKLRSGVDRKAVASLQAKGFLTAVPPPVSAVSRFAAEPDVTVQLVASTGACWTSTFAAADFKLDTIAKTNATHAGP